MDDGNDRGAIDSFDGAKFRGDYLRNFYELGRKNLELPRTRASTDRVLDSGGTGAR